jgi:hypothetical protein
MKIKSNSKRDFKRILRKMIASSDFKMDAYNNKFYAAGNFDCGVKTYKGYDVRFIPVGYFGFKRGYIYLAPNMYVQENDCNK